MVAAYPSHCFYGRSGDPPEWATDLLAVVAAARPDIDSIKRSGVKSDEVLARLRPGLERLGYAVETGKKKAEKVCRPVANGGASVYDVDAWREEDGIVVEVEAGRGAWSNAIFRDVVRSSLLEGAENLAIGVMLEYRSRNQDKIVKKRSFDHTKKELDAIYSSGRLVLPFEGVLLFGY